VRKQPPVIAVLTLASAPLALAVGAAGGALAAAAVAATPAAHTALISFGIAALLYLVTEELLVEAHEGLAEEHVWYIDFWFFFGFMASFLLEKFS
jgi:ZIP family zinc transporter